MSKFDLKMKEFTCVCGKGFSTGRAFAGHKSMCAKHYESVGKSIKDVRGKAWSASQKTKQLKSSKESVMFDGICEKCNKQFQSTSREKRFCTRSCANSRLKSKETIQKHSLAARGKRRTAHKVCMWCGKEYYGRRKRHCSEGCAISTKRIQHEKYLGTLTDRKRYGLLCRFNFSIDDYPEEFNLESIQRYGKYSAKNRGNNHNGVCRDHMYSIEMGYRNNIDHKIISHPANCELITGGDNRRKGIKCSISLEDLLDKIRVWESKYGVWDC